MRSSICLLVALAAHAATTATVSDVVSTVRGDLERNQSDARTASAIRKLDLMERLDWRTVEELETEGAGPKTVTTLEMMVDESEALPAPAQVLFPSPAKPPVEEQNRVLAAATRNSLNYAASLPDFICTETVRRYE